MKMKLIIIKIILMLVLITMFSRNVVGILDLAGNNGYVADVAYMFHMSAPLMECTKY
jgi:hypothetical protein